MRLLFVAAICAGLLGAQTSGNALDALASKSAAANYREYIELLAIPNVSAVPADIQKNAAFLDAAFQKRGFKTTIWPNNGRPLLFAELLAAHPEKKTVLFYMHMDGQPVTPSEWHQESPFEPVLKHRGQSGAWESIPLEQLYGSRVDPEWRVFARGAGDDKGPIEMFLSAMDALRSTGQDPAINIKVVIDPEEEGGGAKGLRSFVAERAAQMKTDALVAFDGPMEEDNKPVLEFGFRGGAGVHIIVFGAKIEVHSGNFGNYAPNPLQKLARLIGNMKDDDGRVTIPGFYDAVKLDPETQKILAAVPFNEAALNRRLGIAAREQVGHNLAEALMYPTLTVSRMVGGSLGPDGKVVPFAGAVIPAVASADIQIRAVPETPPDYLRPVFTKYLQSQGYHLVEGQPTDEERARYRDLAIVTVSGGGGAMRTEINTPLGDWMRRAYKRAFGEEPELIPQMGAGLPIGAIVEGLKVPFVISPLANSDDNQHTFDENLRLQNYINGTKSILALLQERF